MGRTHSNAFRQVNQFFECPIAGAEGSLRAQRGARAERSPTTGDMRSFETDWRKLVDRKDIDLIDIASPNDTHADIAIAAAKAGKMVHVRKAARPKRRRSAEMRTAVETAGVPNMVWYNYRRVPAVTLAKQLIDEGRLGRIFHYRAKFLQDWTISQDLPQGGEGLWRLDVNVAGSGVTGDLLAHSIDTALWLNGRLTEVTAMTETFIKERKHNLTGRVEPVGIDDASAFLPLPQRLAGDVRSDPLRARPQGPLHSRNQWRACIASLGPSRSASHPIFRPPRRRQHCAAGDSIHVTDGDHPYMKHWWVPGFQIGYEHTFIHQVADFLQGARRRETGCPDIPRRSRHRSCNRRSSRFRPNPSMA